MFQSDFGPQNQHIDICSIIICKNAPSGRGEAKKRLKQSVIPRHNRR